MKNFLLLGLITILLAPTVEAREPLLPDPSIVVDTGHIETNALIASPGGEAFIEFSSDTNFVHEEGLLSFSGEILPPAIISLPDKRPRLRMEPLLSFELITDSGDPILFADRFDLKNTHNKLREQYLNPETTARSSWVKFIMPIEDEFVGIPQLWEYIGPEEGWAKIGGITDEPSPEGVRVFSTILRRTGVYTVFDENPAPKHYADEFDFSQEENMDLEEFWNESNGELPDGFTWEELQSMTIDGEITSREEFNNMDDIPEAGISVNDRAITINEKVALEARKTQLISQVSRATDPADITLLRELLTLIERKILIADQREQLVARKTQLEAAIPQANTEKLQKDLSDQLAMVEAQLRNLEDVALEQRINEIEGSLHVEIEKEIVLTPIVEEPEIEIPDNAELPQSGAMGSEGESPSLVFPLALLLVLLFVIASGIMASRKKH